MATMAKRGWFVKHIHGNQFLSGMPDLFCYHPRFGLRMVELKIERGKNKYLSFTDAQKLMFPVMATYGIGIWVLVKDTIPEYQKLMKPPNWKFLMPNKYLKPNPNKLIAWPEVTGGKEAIIQEEICANLRQAGWFTIHLHANMYMSGFPDLFCYHLKYGLRMVEIKNPDGYSFTPAQKVEFPKMLRHNIGIWILFNVNQIPILYERPNLKDYMT